MHKKQIKKKKHSPNLVWSLGTLRSSRHSASNMMWEARCLARDEAVVPQNRNKSVI